MFDIIFCFIIIYVRSLNCISTAINRKIKCGSGVLYYISSYCKYNEEKQAD